jgi:osmotically inducible lipoprotein OsmB
MAGVCSKLTETILKAFYTLPNFKNDFNIHIPWISRMFEPPDAMSGTSIRKPRLLINGNGRTQVPRSFATKAMSRPPSKVWNSALNTRNYLMRSKFKIAIIVLALATVPMVTQAGTLEGVAIGAGTGAVVAGPPGAIVGGVIGAVVGGPNIVRHSRNRTCWINSNGYRQCAWR